jgi:hypothetical protein
MAGGFVFGLLKKDWRGAGVVKASGKILTKNDFRESLVLRLKKRSTCNEVGTIIVKPPSQKFQGFRAVYPRVTFSLSSCVCQNWTTV